MLTHSDQDNVGRFGLFHDFTQCPLVCNDFADTRFSGARITIEQNPFDFTFRVSRFQGYWFDQFL